MPPAILFVVLLLGGTAVILAGAALAYRYYLDHVEDWNPWAPVAMVGGRHRLGTVADPYRMPGWTWSRRLPTPAELLDLIPRPQLPAVRTPAVVIEGDTPEWREPEEGEIRELSTID